MLLSDHHHLKMKAPETIVENENWGGGHSNELDCCRRFQSVYAGLASFRLAHTCALQVHCKNKLVEATQNWLPPRIYKSEIFNVILTKLFSLQVFKYLKVVLYYLPRRLRLKEGEELLR